MKKRNNFLGLLIMSKPGKVLKDEIISIIMKLSKRNKESATRKYNRLRRKDYYKGKEGKQLLLEDLKSTTIVNKFKKRKKPVKKKPSTRKPSTRKPVKKKPSTRKSSKKKPSTRKPSKKKSSTRKPAKKKPTKRKIKKELNKMVKSPIGDDVKNIVKNKLVDSVSDVGKFFDKNIIPKQAIKGKTLKLTLDQGQKLFVKKAAINSTKILGFGLLPKKLFKKVTDFTKNFDNKRKIKKKDIIVDTIENVKETLKDITKKPDVSIKTAVPGKNTIGAIADAAGRALKSADFVAFKELKNNSKKPIDIVLSHRGDGEIIEVNIEPGERFIINTKTYIAFTSNLEVKGNNIFSAENTCIFVNNSNQRGVVYLETVGIRQRNVLKLKEKMEVKPEHFLYINYKNNISMKKSRNILDINNEIPIKIRGPATFYTQSSSEEKKDVAFIKKVTTSGAAAVIL